MSKSALIVGATGLVGEHCLNTLLNTEHYQSVVALTRRPLGSEWCEAYPKKLKNIVVDFDDLESLSLETKVDDVFCCLGTTLKQAGSVSAFRKVDFDYCLELAKVSKSLGAQKFLVVTAVNANAGSIAYYSKVKGQLQNALMELDFERLYIFQPSFLLGDRKNQRLLEGLVGGVTEVISGFFIGKLASYKAIESEVVAKSMVGAAVRPESRGAKRVEYFLYNKMQKLAEAI